MRYLITLTPLEPFLFGGDTTYGKIGSETQSSYLVKSREFPQQSAILGMLRKEMMTQAGLLTRKVRGEWVDTQHKREAAEIVGTDKFDIQAQAEQYYGLIDSLSPIFLMQDKQKFIKKVAIDKYVYKDGLLEGYTPKTDIYDNFISLDNSITKKAEDIFKSIEQTGNKIGGEDNSLFKKTSYLLKEKFKFAFYLESEYTLQNSIITLGADRSSFKLEVKEDNTTLNYKDKNGYLTLLSDTYISVPLKANCDFAITSELSYQNLQNKKHAFKHNEFQKSKKVYLYEKGSVVINPSAKLLENINNKNCQKIGYNIFAQGEK